MHREGRVRVSEAFADDLIGTPVQRSRRNWDLRPCGCGLGHLYGRASRTRPMCDYCDCRSHPEIADLSIEHEQLTSLLSHQLLTSEQWTRISDDQRTEIGSLR